MSAPLPLYQVIHQRISAALPRCVPRASLTRLALLVTGLLAAKSAVLAQIAAERDALALTRATPPSASPGGCAAPSTIPSSTNARAMPPSCPRCSIGTRYCAGSAASS